MVVFWKKLCYNEENPNKFVGLDPKPLEDITMAEAHTFRSAFKGFRRQDVVNYIEYLNAKHTAAVNQLKSENQALADELEALRNTPVVDPELPETCAKLQEENQQLTARIQELTEEIAQLNEQLAEASKPSRWSEEELEAYRRAERAERTAQERAQQIYHQATGTLADATAQVDEAANQFKQMSQQLNAQMSDLQIMVDRSRNALMGAAATMYSIRPTDQEAE